MFIHSHAILITIIAKHSTAMQSRFLASDTSLVAILQALHNFYFIF
jgi:hypothetical protein